MNQPETPASPRRSWRRAAIIAAILVAAAGGAVGLARAAGMGPVSFGHGCLRPGMARDFAEFRVQKMLQKVNATDGQQKANAGAREQLHREILAALTGPTVDRAALETARADAVSRIEQGSKELAKALGDMAEVLTPAQRQQLASLAQHHSQ
jgi:protein CpxP